MLYQSLIERAQPLEYALDWGCLRGLGWGNVDKPRYILLHGWLDNCHSFLPLIEQLHEPDDGIIALDWAGHGYSDHRPTGNYYHFTDYAYDIWQLIKIQEWSGVTIIGHSMGGFVAMRYLEGALSRGKTSPIAGLSLLASVPPSGLWGPSLSLMTFQPTLFFELAMIQSGQPSWMSLDSVNRALFTPATPKDAAHAYYARLSTESRRAVMEMQGRCACPYVPGSVTPRSPAPGATST